MILFPGISISELAFAIGETFISNGVTAVLSGGAAAEVYAPGAYQSQDLDFILQYTTARAKLLTDLGFEMRNSMYHHQNFAWTVEFPKGPLGIGEDYAIRPVRLTCPKTQYRLDILSPTDCVRDRLTHFLLPQRVDFSALEQAVAVAKELKSQIDINFIAEWAKQEGSLERFELFKARL